MTQDPALEEPAPAPSPLPPGPQDEEAHQFQRGWEAAVRYVDQQNAGGFSDDPAELSRLLWDARQAAQMLGDLLRATPSLGGPDYQEHDTVGYDLRDRIDNYRAERGWTEPGLGDGA